MKETRIFAAPVEVRGESGEVATIAGYASVFDTAYEVFGFTESVSPRAFNKTLKERADALAVVWSHDADRVLGTVASDTARFAVDDHGLRYEADLDLKDPDGLGAWRKIKTGKVRQSSFAFEAVKDKWEEREDAPPHRTLLEVKLYEASPVLFPASSSTDVDIKRALKSYAEYRGVDPAIELGGADTIATIRAATSASAEDRDDNTEEPSPEPGDRSEDTPQPEPQRIRSIIVKGLNG